MAKIRVVVTDDRFGSYEEEKGVLAEVDAALEVLNLGDEAQTIEALREADAILVNLHPMPGSVIRSLARCRVISRYGVGYDNVDVAAATEKGIWVARVPDYCFEDVSDHALALLLACIRKVAYKDRRVRQGAWNLIHEQRCHRAAGKTLGLVGYGHVARALHRKVSGLGLAAVLAYDPYVEPKAIAASGAEPVPFRRLLRESDFISIHAPLDKETRHMIGARALGQMKRSAILINTSRGGLVDEQAVARALAGGRIAAAGLDVFEAEPLPPDSPLLRLDNVTLSDHAGWYSEESVVELKTKTARNALAVLQGGRPDYPVNNPATGPVTP
jgi:D-3-phosphoglycerate dehydrogenase